MVESVVTAVRLGARDHSLLVLPLFHVNGLVVGTLAPLAADIGPTVAEVATPIDAVPTKTLERLSGDMDPKAIK